MSDANGFVVAAYVLTVMVVGGYAVVLLHGARASERRLAALREAEEARAGEAREVLSPGGTRQAASAAAPHAARPRLELEGARGSSVQA